MAERRRDSGAADREKMQQHQDFLDKFNVRQQMKEALLKLIENRPEDPLNFLADFFESISAENKADRVSNAVHTLQLSHHSASAFQNNMVLAYEILSAPKNPNSKKAVNKRSGMSGSIHEELLKFICADVPKELLEVLLARVSCRWNEMVPFEVFRYSITVAYVLQDFLKLSEDLYQILSGKNENEADKYLCDTTIETFKETLSHTGNSNVPIAADAARRLRPDSLATAMLQAKDDEGDGKETTTSAEFVHLMANVYLDNVKCVR